MNWQINYEGTFEVAYDQPDPTFEIDNKKMSELGGQEESGSDTGKLYLVERSELTPGYAKGKYVNPFDYDIYRRLRSRFEAGAIVSYPQIRELFPEIKPFHLSMRLARLWAWGYLEKYAKGKHGRYWRAPKETKGYPRGKYFGVHYRILEK